MTDGLLVHNEKWLGLDLLRGKYRERVKCIYIDSPHNTGSDEFVYRDDCQHSSWLAMMENRLVLAYTTMARDGLIFVSVDDNEQARLKALLDYIFSWENLSASIACQKRVARSNNAKRL